MATSNIPAKFWPTGRETAEEALALQEATFAWIRSSENIRDFCDALSAARPDLTRSVIEDFVRCNIEVPWAPISQVISLASSTPRLLSVLALRYPVNS